MPNGGGWKSFEDTQRPTVWRSLPDLILFDINLPQARAGSAGKQSRKVIPVMVPTSRDLMRDELYALELGAWMNIWTSSPEGVSALLNGLMLKTRQ